MVRNGETYSELRDLPGQFLVGFCLGCAERASGVLVTLADQEDAAWFSHALEVAWRAPLGEADEDELIEILEEFEGRTESIDADDPGSRGFSLVQSAMLTVNAIAVHLNPHPGRAEMSGQVLETILGSFDFKLGDGVAVVTRAGEDEETGRLQRLEQAAQDAFVASVRGPRGGGRGEPRPDREFLRRLRASCVPARDEFRGATVSVAELAGWDLE
ncbi:hypothetical protein ACFU96_07235 [Streptomyces sp. NPDC057620]|uniref:hypothetical protein n=1 Tax=Streptomyces sp. NPDC057620 TaxID=3346185 RepID=UPI00368CF1D3